MECLRVLDFLLVLFFWRRVVEVVLEIVDSFVSKLLHDVLRLLTVIAVSWRGNDELVVCLELFSDENDIFVVHFQLKVNNLWGNSSDIFRTVSRIDRR